MSTNVRRRVSYGLSQPYFNASPMPIVSTRDPRTTDYAEIGTEWINSSSDQVWVITSVVTNQAIWTRVDNSTVNAGITWTTLAGAGPIVLAGNYGYYLTNVGAIALTLPAAATLGSQIYITTQDSSAAAAGFVISQNALQYIKFCDEVSTVGVGGSLNGAGAQQASLTMLLICTIANTEFTVFTANFVPNLV